MFHHRIVVAVLASVIVAGGYHLVGGAEEGEPTGAIHYSKWTALTPKPVAVHQDLFRRCERSPATQKRIKDLQKRDGPHFVPAIKLFANPEAEKALKDDPKATLPVGGTIVKEKLDDSVKAAKLLAYGAMIKREPGYDPEHGDWEYVYADLSGAKPKIERGKIATCIQCHSIAKDRDYLYRTHFTKTTTK